MNRWTLMVFCLLGGLADAADGPKPRKSVYTQNHGRMITSTTPEPQQNRDFILRVMRQNTRRQFAPFIKAQNMGADQKGAFLDALSRRNAEIGMNSLEVSVVSIEKSLDADGRNELREQLALVDQEIYAAGCQKLVEILGPERFRRFQEFERDASYSRSLKYLRDAFAKQDLVLTPTEERGLIEAFVETRAAIATKSKEPAKESFQRFFDRADKVLSGEKAIICRETYGKHSFFPRATIWVMQIPGSGLGYPLDRFEK